MISRSRRTRANPGPTTARGPKQAHARCAKIDRGGRSSAARWVAALVVEHVPVLDDPRRGGASRHLSNCPPRRVKLPPTNQPPRPSAITAPFAVTCASSRPLGASSSVIEPRSGRPAATPGPAICGRESRSRADDPAPGGDGAGAGQVVIPYRHRSADARGVRRRQSSPLLTLERPSLTRHRM